MSAWRILVDWFLPPPLILTMLLILPMPATIKKGILNVTRQFLFYRIGGHLRLVHLALVVTGAVFAGSAVNTYHMSRQPVDSTLTPNQRTAILARRWREERNFWIAALTFLLWGLLYRFYQLVSDHVAAKDRLRQLELAAAAGGYAPSGVTAAAAPAGGKAGGKAAAPAGPVHGGKGGGVEPSAPTAPSEVLASEAKKVK